MARLPSVTPRQVIQALQKAGFRIHHQTGGHVRMLHFTSPERRLTVPIHGSAIPKGTLANIIRQSGLTRPQFLELL